MSFWGELKRRNVFKVGAAYLIAAWLIVQVANTFFPILHLPEWTVTFIAALLILGLPVALILAWAYEMTPEGVKLTKKVPLSDSITQVTGRRLNYVLAGLIIVLVGYIAILQFFINKAPVQTEVASTVSEQTPPIVEVEDTPKTIAVLPFANLSSDPEQEYFVDGLTEELLNSLSQIPGLNVTGRTSAFTFKDSGKTVQEIAAVLGVENILEGSVRKAGNALRITAQLLRAADGFHLWSKTYDRELKDIFAVQEDIATAVTNELKVKLGIDSTQETLGGTDNAEAYQYYLIAQGFRREETVSGFNKALESLDAATSMDPGYALAWTFKGKVHIALSIYVAHDLIASEREAVLTAALKAIEIEPNLSDAYALLGHYRFAKSDFFAAESSFRKAIELKKKQSSYIVSDQDVTKNWDAAWAFYLLSVGYLEKAYNHIEALRLNDPFILPIRALYVMSLGMRGDIEQAEQESERCRAMFGDRWDIWEWSINWLRLNDGDFVIPNEEFANGAPGPVLAAGIKHIDSPEEGLLELHRIYNNNEDIMSFNFNEMSIWAAYFGDLEFALDAEVKAFGLESSWLFLIWHPLMKEVRQLPRFKEWVRDIGLVDYWNEFGWPDLCHPTDDGDFVCD